MKGYVELRAASAFSFLGAASNPEDLVETAADLGLPGMALADNDGVYGIPRFVKACRSAGISPICGATVTVDLESLALPEGRKYAPLHTGSRTGSRTGGLHPPCGSSLPSPEKARLLLLCRDTAGWGNLCAMITAAQAGREKDDPLVTADMLSEFAGGLVCIAGGMDGPAIRAAVLRGPDAGGRVAAALSSIFGPGALFLDLQRHGDPAGERANTWLADLAERLGVGTIATNDVRYATAARSRVYDVLLAIRNHTPLDLAGRAIPRCHRQFMRGADEMRAVFADHPGIIDRTCELAESLPFDLTDTGYRFPEYPVTPPDTEFDLLCRLVRDGLPRRYPRITPAVTAQVAHELDIIGKLGLAGYFLLVHDIVGFCRDNGILAQGRGSAANSAVCYALGITAIDPVGMGLLFERFLSEERGEWPDIDLDLPSGDERERVIQHVYSKYGTAHVGMTAAVTTFRGRSAIREAGTAFGLDQDCIARLSKLFRHYEFREDDDSFADKLKMAGLDPDDPYVSGFMDVWHDMQDLPRHISQHNGGLVISGTRLDRVVPIVPARMPGRRIIQWDKDDIADMHLIKVDLLGLGMLAAVSRTIELISRHEGRDIDLAHIPKDDPVVWDTLCRADTVGVFQIESRAQMATLPRMKPRCFYDLVIEVAIIRPGPIVGKMVHPFLNRRSGVEPVRYAAPCLEPILERTLGIPLFQEQLMRMAMAAAGFSGGESEELRRAMGSRRSLAKMARLVEKLHAGMATNGIDTTARDDIVNSITSFALYGFPESHAASFALIAWASAWLKVHHHAAFTAALLNCWPMGFYAPATLVQDAILHGVQVLPIDVNRSEGDCTLERTPDGKLAIRLGLKFIKGLAEQTIARIVASRSADGPYRDILDVGERTYAGRAELMLLADAGAAPPDCSSGTPISDGLDDSRRDALWQAMAFDPGASLLHRHAGDRVPAAAHGCMDDRGDHDADDGDGDDDDADDVVDRGDDDRGDDSADVRPHNGFSGIPGPSTFQDMLDDYRTTGMTVGRHPMAFIRDGLDDPHLLRASDLPMIPDGARARVAGMIIVRQRPPTARGFYFATIEDETGHAAIAVRPDVFMKNKLLLSTAAFLLFDGRIQNRSGVTSLLADTFRVLQAPVNHQGRNFH